MKPEVGFNLIKLKKITISSSNNTLWLSDRIASAGDSNKYIMLTRSCNVYPFTPNFYICGSMARFVLGLVGYPDDKFSRDAFDIRNCALRYLSYFILVARKPATCKTQTRLRIQARVLNVDKVHSILSKHQ